MTVNTLLPGLILTDRTRELGADAPERLATIPAGRLGTVPEFAAAAAFLCSEPAGYITGTTLTDRRRRRTGRLTTWGSVTSRG